LNRMLKMTGNIVLLIILVFGVVLISCEEITTDTSVDCGECYQEAPEWGDLKIEVTINEENEEVPVVIYKGRVEDSVVEWVDTATVEDYRIDVPVNEYYSVTAKYRSGDMTITAIDGDKIKTKYITDECDEDCYVIRGGDMDVRLKY